MTFRSGRTGVYSIRTVRWLLTIAYRWRPGNTEWQYKTVVARKPPEQWLADRLGRPEVGEHQKLDVNILYARQIEETDAEALEKALEDHQ